LKQIKSFGIQRSTQTNLVAKNIKKMGKQKQSSSNKEQKKVKKIKITENSSIIDRECTFKICIYSDILVSVEIDKGKGKEISIPNTLNIPQTGILSKIFRN